MILKADSRESESTCGLGTTSLFRFKQLVDESNSFSRSVLNDNALQCRPFRRPHECSTSYIHELVLRPGCYSYNLGGRSRVCVSPVCVIARRLKKIRTEKTSILIVTAWTAQHNRDTRHCWRFLLPIQQCTLLHFYPLSPSDGTLNGALCQGLQQTWHAKHRFTEFR